MYRFLLRPKWIMFHAVVAAGIVAMVALSSWQWTKYGDRQQFVDTVEQRLRAEPLDLTSMLATATPAEIEYHRVTATGTYLVADELVQINRTQGSVNGVNVLTPFRIEGGGVVVVNRGFVADGAAISLPPMGTLVVGGTARLSQARKTGELTDNDSGATNEVRRVDLALIATRLGAPIEPVYIELIATQPDSPQPPDPVPAPNLDGGPPHLAYAIQWIIFSVCVAVGWVFAVRRSVRTRRRAAAGSVVPIYDEAGNLVGGAITPPAVPSA